MDNLIEQSANLIKKAKHVTVFTGAGISVESGIPPFRGADGLWSKYNPVFLEIDYFYQNPLKAWQVINEIFYDFFGKAKPNDAHFRIAELEKKGMVKAIITQNIDNLHQEAGSKTVYEFHGNSKKIICTKCNTVYKSNEINLSVLPPKCSSCDGLLKPDFIFFGEGIPEPAGSLSFNEADKADVFIIIGTTGEVMPASMIPQTAKQNGCSIIEVNPEKSLYTRKITDIFLQGKATEILNKLYKAIIK